MKLRDIGGIFSAGERKTFAALSEMIEIGRRANSIMVQMIAPEAQLTGPNEDIGLLEKPSDRLSFKAKEAIVNGAVNPNVLDNLLECVDLADSPVDDYYYVSRELNRIAKVRFDDGSASRGEEMGPLFSKSLDLAEQAMVVLLKILRRATRRRSRSCAATSSCWRRATTPRTAASTGCMSRPRAYTTCSSRTFRSCCTSSTHPGCVRGPRGPPRLDNDVHLEMSAGSLLLLFPVLFLSVALVSGNNLAACVGTALGAQIVSRRFAVALGAAGFTLGLLTLGARDDTFGARPLAGRREHHPGIRVAASYHGRVRHRKRHEGAVLGDIVADGCWRASRYRTGYH